MDKFIPRKFKIISDNNKTNENDISTYPTKQLSTFGDIIKNCNKISVILGEPASGKTFQLKEYHKNNANSHFVELINIEDEEIVENREIFLLDSIDEALIEYNTNKKFKAKLFKFIKSVAKSKQNLKFIITCRYLEWKEYFEKEFQELDENLKVYEIAPLTKEEINRLLPKDNIGKFWNFISKNYLEPLLKNILIIKHLIENFKTYDENTNYIEIYENITKKYISEVGKYRDELNKDISLEKQLLIASSLATYMTLNKKESIESDKIIASKLYKIDNNDITLTDLESVLNTALFKKVKNEFKFFHKSMQEYLTAYFINYKELDFNTIKQLFAHNLRFYEVFEEVIIYLTNIETRFFKYIVEFDPFIFRRHPALTKEQQENLFLSVIKKLKNEEQMIYGRWDYFNNTTIVTYRKIDNLPKLVKDNISIEEINILLFSFIMSLLKYNYSKELEDYIFKILDKQNKETCRQFINDNHFENYDFNLRLLNYLKERDLQKNFDNLSDRIEKNIFKTLYGIKNSYLENFEFEYTNIDFKKIIHLLLYIPIYELEYIIPNLKSNDIKILFEYLKINDIDNFSNELILLSVYSFLLNKIDIEKILSFLKKHNIHLHNRNTIKNKLPFNNIDNKIWNIFFSQNNVDYIIQHYIIKILDFYNITVDDIKTLTQKFPIEENCEYYIKFRFKVENIDEFLMENDSFRDYWNKLQKEIQDEWDIEDEDKKDFEKYQNLIKNFSTKNDLYNILNYAKHSYGDHFVDNIKSDLGDKYLEFIEKAKIEFINDNSYLKIKEDINSNSILYSTIFYKNSLQLLSHKELNELINKKEKYQKLFWYLFSYYKLDKQYFIDLTRNRFLDEFISLSVESIKLSLQQSSNKKITNYYQIEKILKDFNKFNKVNLQKLIDYIATIKENTFKTIDEQLKRILLSILSLDKDKYLLVKKFMDNDLENISIYLSTLLGINAKKAIKDFDEIYKNIPRYISFDTKNSNYNFLKPVVFHMYNKPHINNKKIIFFIEYLLALKGNKNYNILDTENIKNILLDYYEFFNEYKRNYGFSFIDNYDNMHDLINNLWQLTENSKKYVNILENLSHSNIKLLAYHSKHCLENLYNQNINDIDYKNILDNYTNKKDIFFSYDKLRDDLITIALTEINNRNAVYKESEDETNDRFRNALIYKNYNVADQSRGGESSTGVNAGERDLVIRNNEGMEESVIEAFILNSLNRDVITKHYEKLINRYDTVGNKTNFILVYVKSENFEELWKKYIVFDKFNDFKDTKDKFVKKTNVKIGLSKNRNMNIYHIFINFYSEHSKDKI